MNYRFLLSEMLIDYRERFEAENEPMKKDIYKEVVNDLKLALDIEPNEQALVNEAAELLKSNEYNITPVVDMLPQRTLCKCGNCGECYDRILSNKCWRCGN